MTKNYSSINKYYVPILLAKGCHFNSLRFEGGRLGNNVTYDEKNTFLLHRSRKYLTFVFEN